MLGNRMWYLNALEKMVIVLVKHGFDFIKSFYRKWDMKHLIIPITKSILKLENQVCSVNCGFQ